VRSTPHLTQQYLQATVHLVKIAALYIQCFLFCHPLFQNICWRTSLITFSCAAFLLWKVRVICVVRMDVDMVLLSCYYVPHWCVCLYTVGQVELCHLLLSSFLIYLHFTIFSNGMI
jgi:hypothetical protein